MVGAIAVLLSAAFGATATLSQRDVAELALKQGPNARLVTQKYEQQLFTVTDARSVLDWKVILETGYLKDRTETLSRYLNDSKIEKMTTTATLSKSLLLGTNLSLALSRDSYKSDQVVGTLPADVVADKYALSIEQPIWGFNMFGVGYRAQINGAELTYESAIVLRANELENVVLDALRLYWDTYVLQEQFRESLAVRDRYEKLVGSVRRKTSVGYNNPGELSQAQAEYEARIQKVKLNSAQYLASLEKLVTSLGLEPGTELVFNVPKELPPVPKLEAMPPENLRALRSAELNVRAAREALRLAESVSSPALSLVGRVGATGVDENAESSYSELTSGSHPETYVGVRFQAAFGSGSNSERIRRARAILAQAETSLELARNQERDGVLSLERKVSTQYAVAQSAARQREFREKAMQELTRTYNQGRTNLKDLIDAMNSFFDSEVQVIRSLGDYQVALNEWAAARDELIPDQKEGSK